jgi:Tfp pilus assembly protein PilV
MAKKLLIKGIKSLKQVLCDVHGIALTEALVAMGILAVVAVAYLMGMSATSKAVMVSQERVTAENLAKSQVEYIRSQEYQDDPQQYLEVDTPNGYGIYIQGDVVEVGLQKLTVVVDRDGAEVLRLEDYRMKR